MSLVTTTEMFKKAYDGGYAIGAFNFSNMEIVQAITESAAETRSPVILQVSGGARKYAKQEYIMAMVNAAVADTGVDCALHLDHGDTFELCCDCIDGGFTSVMIDGSKYDFEENVRLTKQVVDYAHSKGVSVEGELGKLAGVEDEVKVDKKSATYTDPAQAQEFVERTGVDSLAIAIGTSHGAYKFTGNAALRFDILEEVERRLPGFPIVLHGASSVDIGCIDEINRLGGNLAGAKGVPEDMLRRATSMAVCKINIDSDIRLAMTAAIRRVFVNDPSAFDPRIYLTEAKRDIKALVKHKIINVLGSDNKN